MTSKARAIPLFVALLGATPAVALAQGGQNNGGGGQPLDDLTLHSSYPIGTQPTDVVITPNRRVAIVRGTQNGAEPLTFYNMRNGNKLTATGSGPTGTGVHVAISDAVAATNDRIVSIGSDTIENTTTVEILAIDYTSGVGINYVGSYATSGPGEPGLASDIAITPDQTTAVITCRERILVVDLTAPTVVVTEISDLMNGIGRPRFTYGDQKIQSADTVEVTDNYAVVAMTKLQDPGDGNCSAWRPIVHVVDLGTNSLVLSEVFALDPEETWSCSPRWTHDLAITPDGSRAVVTATSEDGGATTAVCQLEPTPQLQWEVPVQGGYYFRTQRHCVDSVAVSDTRAVVAHRSSISVIDITEPDPDFAVTRSVIPVLGDYPHDIGISTDGDHAIITGYLTTYVITDVEGISPSVTTITNPGGSSVQASLAAPVVGFVSDSVVVGGDTAITLSTNQAAETGYVRFIDLSTGTVLSTDVLTTTPNPMTTELLVDLTLSPNWQYAYVRGVGTDMGVIGYDTATRARIDIVPLTGTCPGVDDLEATNRGAITVSETSPGVTRVDIIEL